MKGFVKILIFLPLVSVRTLGQSDSLKIESLKKVLLTQANDTVRVNALNELSAELASERDEAMQYARQALLLSQKINYEKGQGDANYNYGVALKGSNYIGEQGSLSEVLSYLNKAINVYKKTGGNELELANCYFQISLAYVNLDQNLPEGIKNMLSALSLYEKTGNKQKIASCYMQLGQDYINDNNDSSIKQGLNTLKSALHIYSEIKDSSQIAYTAHLIGDTYLYSRKYDEALQYLNSCLDIYKALGSQGPDFGVSWTNGSIADVYMAQGSDAISAGNRKLASTRLKTALKMFKERVEMETAGHMSHRQSYNELGDCYFYLSKISAGKEVIANLLESRKYYLLDLEIGIKTNHKAIISDCYDKLSEVSNALGNYKQAYHDYKSFIRYRDSLYNEENTKRTLRAQMQYEFDKEQAIAKAEQEKRNAEQKRIKNNQYFAIGALAIIILAVLSIAIIQWRNSRHKQRANALLQRQKEKVEGTLSELKSTQQQLIQSEKMASLGELTAGIAHEIQNPLNFVNNFSEVNKELISDLKTEIEKGNYGEVKTIANDLEDNEEKILHHGKRADAIVKGMLQHSRRSSGQKELTDINALADEYLRLSYHGFRAKDKSFNAKLETHFDDTVGKINVIPQDIGRVILNLINNAFYALSEKKKAPQPPKGGVGHEPSVTVSTKKIGDKVEIRVRDNGTGIPQKVLDKIFQPFFTTKPTGQGTGLGLSLAYDIIKAHRGEIKVETLPPGEAAEGAEFVVQLPVA